MTQPDPFQTLLDVLDLESLGTATISVAGAPGETADTVGESERDIFQGISQPMIHGRVFGGQILGQSIIAAGRTVAELDGPARAIHSLHAYFVRPGDDKLPIRFSVQRVRDGGSFSVRRVHALQKGETIFTMHCSFQEPSEGLEHQDPMPPAPDPESLPTAADQIGHVDLPAAQQIAYGRPIDLRHVQGGVWARPGEEHIAHEDVWMRTIGRLPDDPLVHAAVMAYASDYSLLEPVLRKHGITWADPDLRAASLDHSMWFHRPARIDEWTLYTIDSPSAQSGRGLGTGRMFAQDGTLACTVAQEGMVRLKPRS